MKDYDVIVVGAGTAGSVLASRLSEKPSRQVLLVDAGHHYVALNDYPKELLDTGSIAGTMPGHPENWAFTGEIVPGRPYPMPRGKVVGGSSAVNGCYFVRGRRQDFDEWEKLGCDEWSYEKVLPFFIKSETDFDFRDESHGSAGPVPVRRVPYDKMRPISQLFFQACIAAGYSEEPDKNTDAVAGVGPIPHNALDGIRMNTAIAYLSNLADRPNLEVLGETHVRRILFDGTRAVGIEAERAGEIVRWHGAEIVLSAGAIKSPHLLMLSGIGRADVLRAHGIEIVHDSPGVGRNVMDNPSNLVHFVLQSDKMPLTPDYTPLQVSLNYTAQDSPIEEDLQINCSAGSLSMMLRKSGPGSSSRLPSYLTRPIKTLKGLRGLPASFLLHQARNRHHLNLMCGLERERGIGEIELVSNDPSVQPLVKLNYLSEADDVKRMRENVRTAVGLLRSPSLRNVTRRTSPDDDVLGSNATLDAWIAQNLSTSFHTSGGAKMGVESDPDAVVDQYGRLHGIEGLRVFDLSIAPTNVRRGPAATAVMIGERAAEFFR